jgi:hypothetical protein
MKKLKKLSVYALATSGPNEWRIIESGSCTQIGEIKFRDDLRAFEAFHLREGWIATANTLQAVLQSFDDRKRREEAARRKKPHRKGGGDDRR